MSFNLRKLITTNREATLQSSKESNKRLSTKVLASLAVILTACANVVTTRMPTVNPSITSTPDRNGTSTLEIKPSEIPILEPTATLAPTKEVKPSTLVLKVDKSDPAVKVTYSEILNKAITRELTISNTVNNNIDYKVISVLPEGNKYNLVVEVDGKENTFDITRIKEKVSISFYNYDGGLVAITNESAANLIPSKEHPNKEKIDKFNTLFNLARNVAKEVGIKAGFFDTSWAFDENGNLIVAQTIYAGPDYKQGFYGEVARNNRVILLKYHGDRSYIIVPIAVLSNGAQELIQYNFEKAANESDNIKVGPIKSTLLTANINGKTIEQNTGRRFVADFEGTADNGNISFEVLIVPNWDISPDPDVQKKGVILDNYIPVAYAPWAFTTKREEAKSIILNSIDIK